MGLPVNMDSIPENQIAPEQSQQENTQASKDSQTAAEYVFFLPYEQYVLTKPSVSSNRSLRLKQMPERRFHT
jgi:hypothetical protein